MAKRSPYSRREFRRRQRHWLGKNWQLILGLGIGLIILIGAALGLLSVALDRSPVMWIATGALPTAMVALYFHLLHTAFLAHDSEAIWHVRGAWGEDNTRDELHRARRKGLIWGWADSLELQVGDIDHLVVTRHGGLVAVDSKWRNRVSDPAEMARAAHKVRLRAEALTRDLLKGDSRGMRRARVNPLSVTPVVVLWGTAQHGVPVDAEFDGIRFVAGRQLLGWLKTLDTHSVDREAAMALLRQLEERRTHHP